MQARIPDDIKLADLAKLLQENPSDEFIISRGLFLWLLCEALRIPKDVPLAS